MSSPTIVLVTGAAGYIASWVIKQLLEKGKYKVRGTVRSVNDANKVSHLQQLFPDLELFEADLLKEGSFDKACEGCEIVFHTASPFQLQVGDPQKDLVDPALKGTLNVLRSAEKAGTVRRVIVTSSVAAIASTKKPEEYVFSEEDWNNDSSVDHEPYRYSKTVAEKAAEEFAVGKKFDVVRICPSFVVGPPLSKRTDGTSVGLIRDFLEGKFYEKGTNPSCFGTIDVRDIAAAHIAAAEIPEAKGRYLVSSDRGISHLEYAQFLLKSGKFDKYKIPTKESSAPTKRPHFNNTKVQKELGIKISPIDNAIVEMAQALIDLGAVEVL
eukprot:TRINITY_DN1591_c0_g1_i5.p1 TRINITY_DN1591_c0_g1~~TRINITY_DN1591_c0_g1_i5.p1  ORF type:complete len:325 (+),score=100.33 TRINITY_DN1591_c0_g1_i5:270-1244(+)